MAEPISRKTFILGSAAAIAAGSLAPTSASATSRFTYAAGLPAPHQEITSVHGVVQKVLHDRMTVATDSGVTQEVDFSQRPFVWKDRVVPWPEAGKEFRRGQRVLLYGELDSGSLVQYADLQQVWVDVPGLL